MMSRWQRWVSGIRLVRTSARLLVGRHFWLATLPPLVWSGVLAIMLLTGIGNMEAPEPADAQGKLIGFPLAVLAIFLGVRVIAGEVDARRLEIAYTVPGGSHRVWLAKLAAAWGLLVVSEVLLAGVAYAFFTSYPPGALYGALQAATVYLVVAMALAALFKSEVAGAMVTVLVFVLGVFLPGRFSPFWNPLAARGTDPTQLFAWTLQNRIGFLLFIVAVVALGFARAERREKMLAG